MSTRAPPRVLHVLGSLEHGGIQSWLLHVMRNMPAGWWSNEFLLHRTQAGGHEEAVRALGGVVHYLPYTRTPLRYTRGLRELLRQCGPYDVVHSHVHLYSGIVLRAAHMERVPVRVAHNHNVVVDSNTFRRRAYVVLMRRLIRKHATHGLAAAPRAAASLFGEDWQRLARVRIHTYGVDYVAFGGLPDRAACKRRLGIPERRVVVGHVGRFVAEKNHAFVIDTFAEIVRAGVDAHLLLVGSGPLEGAARAQIDVLRLNSRCTLAGAHNETAPFFGALDLLLFPSITEALPIATLEAQAAAVPVLASTAVPPESEVVADLVHRQPLAAGPVAWAAEARRILDTAPRLDRAVTARLLTQSRYGVRRSIAELAELYGCRVHEHLCVQPAP